jgi:hypothetical protein
VDGLAEGALLARDAGWEELTLFEGRSPVATMPVAQAVEWAVSRPD